MNISRSGYYKWLKTKDLLNQYELNRNELFELITTIHKEKRSYGYHRIWKRIVNETGWYVSSNLVHKCCKWLGFKSYCKHYKYKKPGYESIKYPNLVNGSWKTSRPFEIIVSDSTKIWFKKKPYDWTYYYDVFNNEIVGSDVKDYYYGVNMINHKEALKRMLETKIKRGYKDLETIIHTDQGKIYSSMAFTNAHKDYNIKRSMSRAGTPTDNPKIESANGWIKKEMYLDFNVQEYETVQDYINVIIYDYNNIRPAWALKYKNPIEYRTQLGFK
jgi:transposase InsO family protein